MEKERKAYLPIGCVRKMDSQDKMVFFVYSEFNQ